MRPRLLFVALLTAMLSLTAPLFAQCPVGSTVPSVNICSPTNNSTVGTEVNVTATARSSAAISAMKVYVDGVSVYTFHDSTINTDLVLSVGTHKLTVKAWDAAGGVFSSVVNVTATDGSTPPPPPTCTAGTAETVKICAPVSGSTVTSPVDVEAYVTSASTITATKIYVDGVSVWSGTAAKVSASLAMTSGSHKITVKGWTSTNTVLAASTTFTVGSGGTPPPPPPPTCSAGASNTVNICAPASGATVTSPVDVEAYVNASTTLTATKIYVDGVSVWSGTKPQVSASLTMATGAHKITVKGWTSTNVVLMSSVSFTVGTGSTPPPTGFVVMPRQYVTTSEVPVQFTATNATSWSVDGIVGGSADVGTISSTGLYTPPDGEGQHTISATDGTNTANATVWTNDFPGVYTYKYGNKRGGTNSSENALTPANVNTSKFGKLASYPLDGNVYGEVLYAANVDVPGKGVHNIAYVATAHDTVYAFDADAGQTSPLWKVSFLNTAAGITTYPPIDACCVTEVGINSTPVIDPDTQTIYVVAATKENGVYFSRLHALDMTTGAERTNSPVTITASTAGKGDNSTNGVVTFNPYMQMQRAALLLANGAVYIAYASYNDTRPYHGWLMGYDTQTMQQVGAFCVTPDGYEGGIWLSAGGPSADDAGNIYTATGNGTYSASSGGRDYSESLLKFDHNLNVIDYFTPFNWDPLNRNDRDIGSSEVVLLPEVPEGAPEHLAVNVNKGGSLYLLNYDQMGHFNSTSNSQIVQTIGGYNLIRSTPAYWNDAIYFGALDSPLVKLTLTSTGFTATPATQTSFTFPYPGASPVVSANGNTNGIVWATKHGGGAAVIYAFDANNLGSLLWSSDQTSRDTADISVRFSVPTVANGRVYLAGKTSLVIYGLLP